MLLCLACPSIRRIKSKSKALNNRDWHLSLICEPHIFYLYIITVEF